MCRRAAYAKIHGLGRSIGPLNDTFVGASTATSTRSTSGARATVPDRADAAASTKGQTKVLPSEVKISDPRRRHPRPYRGSVSGMAEKTECLGPEGVHYWPGGSDGHDAKPSNSAAIQAIRRIIYNGMPRTIRTSSSYARKPANHIHDQFGPLTAAAKLVLSLDSSDRVFIALWHVGTSAASCRWLDLCQLKQRKNAVPLTLAKCRDLCWIYECDRRKSGRMNPGHVVSSVHWHWR